MPGRSNGRPFISYVGTHLDDEEPDPDGLDQEARMALEEKGVDLILTGEPHLKRTPTHNPGYDLFEAGEDGQPVRWIEVKAMTGDLYDRPVGVSRTQFQCAQQHGEAYWLYVVENAGMKTVRASCASRIRRARRAPSPSTTDGSPWPNWLAAVLLLWRKKKSS